MPQPVLNARAIKCTIVLDPAEVAQIVASDGKPRTVIDIRLPDRRVSADLNAKSVRKAVATPTVFQRRSATSSGMPPKTRPAATKRCALTMACSRPATTAA